MEPRSEVIGIKIQRTLEEIEIASSKALKQEGKQNMRNSDQVQRQ
jgi:hypothetical protein